MFIQNSYKAGKWSFIALLVLCFVYVHYGKKTFSERKVTQPGWTNIIHDIGIYYAYLPATFIKKDPLWKFMEDGNPSDPEKGIQYWAFKTEKGGWAPKMSMGKAFMDLPFFYIADLYTKNSDKYERTGFSLPYQIAIFCSTLFYILFAFALLRVVLLRYFRDAWVAWTLLIVALATNLYHYSLHETGTSHPHNFFLLSAAMYLVHDWNMERKIGKAILFGLVCGLIVLVRPINILLLLPLPFFTQYFQQISVTKEIIVQGLRSFFLQKKFIVAVFAAVVIAFPQLLFWKIQSGSWLHYSYNDEGFFFSNPSIIKGLFSFRKGWFIYTPVMIFAVFGLVYFFRLNKLLAAVLGITFMLFLYVTFSWWCWWYGGGFGARTMIDIYPFLAFGIAAFFAWIWKFNLIIKGLFFIVVILLGRYNIFQTFQYSLSLIHWDSMTYDVYKAIFLKTKFPENYSDLVQEPDYQKQKETGRE